MVVHGQVVDPANLKGTGCATGALAQEDMELLRDPRVTCAGGLLKPAAALATYERR